MCEKRFVKYDGVKIVDLKLDQSWIISIGNVDELLKLLNDYEDKIIISNGKLKEKQKECEELNSYATACDDIITDFETDKYELREFLKEYIKDHEVEPNSFLYDFCKSLGLEL